MDAVYVGWLSILPPMIAIILALITKEVLFSLIAGVLSGTIIYSIASGMNPIVGPVSTIIPATINAAPARKSEEYTRRKRLRRERRWKKEAV